MLTKTLDPKDVNAFSALVEESENIVITCHVRPDGDAIGSSLALYHHLKKMGKSVSVLTPDQAPKSLSFLPGFKDLAPYTKYADYAARLIGEANLIICCDFNKLSRMDDLEPLVKESNAKKVLIDHHTDPEHFADVMFSFPHMSSTCELVFRLLCALGDYEKMDLDVATCLTTGFVTDTRNLSVSIDNPEVYYIMYMLAEKGVDRRKIIRNALEAISLDAFRLKAFTLSERLTLLPEFRTAIIKLSREDLEEFHYEKGDTEGFVNEPLNIQGIVASYFLREDSDCIKVSARSIDNFPVNKICQDLFGGGGHLQAAGGEYKDGSLEDCYKILVDALPQYVKLMKN